MQSPKAKSPTSKDRSNLLNAVTTNTKAIALIMLIVEGLFLSGAALLRAEERLTAFILCGVILAIGLVGCIWLELVQPLQHPTNEPHYESDGDRVNALLGIWTGSYNQPLGPNNEPIVDASIQVNITSTNGTLQGVGRLELPGPDHTHLNIKLRGGFLHNRFLRLDYENVDKDAIQFGALIAELSEDGHAIVGTYAGFGAQTRMIVHGTLRLTK